jgi:hypothetical protein
MSSATCAPACPGSDDLSAVVDGQAAEEISVHTDSCAACRGQVQALRRLDAAIRRRMGPPSGLSERIKQAVRDGASREVLEMPRWWMSPALRLAAAVAVTAAAIAVLVNVLGEHPNGLTETFAATTPAEAGGAGLPPTRSAVLPRGPLIEGPVLVPASVGNGSVGSGSGAGDESPQSLPQRVRHVWTVNDASESASYLKTALPHGSYEVGNEDGNTRFSIVLSDRDLQKLVDGLAAHRWQLVRPDLPQPQKQASVVLTGQQVRYTLVMVEQP